MDESSHSQCSFRKSSLKRMVKKDYQNKEHIAKCPSESSLRRTGKKEYTKDPNVSFASTMNASWHAKPMKPVSLRRIGKNEYTNDPNGSSSSSTMNASWHGKPMKPVSLRRIGKKEYTNDPNGSSSSTMNASWHGKPMKPVRRRPKTGNNDSCASLSMDELNLGLNQSSAHSKSKSSLGGSLRKSLRNILNPKNNDSSGVVRRERGERKQYDCDDDEDDDDYDYDGFDHEDDEVFDNDKLMMILCKELEIAGEE
jgi:hypothetical protein